VNQNFGAAVFDLFLWLIKAGIKPIMTIHDELSYYIDEGQEENARIIIQQSMDKVDKIFRFFL
jgi:DNA polymerase I-like protein with 3'-5' exonuclease and polymerase domains